jgi:hypothetical protein
MNHNYKMLVPKLKIFIDKVFLFEGYMKNLNELMNSNSTHWLKISLVTAIAILIIIIAYLAVPGGSDWEVFRPAALEIIAGRSPYNIELFYHPVWTLLPLIPIALLPKSIGLAVLFLVELMAYTYTLHKLGGTRITLIAFLLSPPVVISLWLRSIDWIPFLGFIMPPQIGLFFISVKPQMGSVVALFWLVEAWRKGGSREVFRVFAPVTFATLISIIIFGPWPLGASSAASLEHNASLWPMSIPVGLALIITTIRKRQLSYAMIASPCLSPYIMVTSYVGALAALITLKYEFISVVIGLWILVIIQVWF